MMRREFLVQVLVFLICFTPAQSFLPGLCRFTHFGRSTYVQLHQTEPGGQGEWSDWDNNAYLEDEFVPDDEDDENVSLSSTLLSLAQITTPDAILKTTQTIAQPRETEDEPAWETAVLKYMKRKGSKGTVKVEEEWYSEEAPYFDEADVQDDEGNWGRSTGAPMIGGGQSSSWMSRTEYASLDSTVILETVAPVPVLPTASAAVIAAREPVVNVPTSSASVVSALVESKSHTTVLPPTLPSRQSDSDDLLGRFNRLERRVDDAVTNIALMKGFAVGVVFMYIIQKAY
jgi:hypothetical protein